MCLTLFFCPETAGTREDDNTSPIYAPDKTNSSTFATEPLSLKGRFNFRYQLQILPRPAPPPVERSPSSYGKKSCPHTLSCGRG